MGALYPRTEPYDCGILPTTDGQSLYWEPVGDPDIPAVLIHGRRDVSSPLDTAWHLHQQWPASELVVLGDAGHGGKGFASAVVSALDGFRRLR